MRFGIGFLVLLIGLGLYLWMQADHAQATLNKSRPAREAASEVAGLDLRGSYDVKLNESNGKPVSLEFTRIESASPLLKMYDLQVGDKIVEIGPFPVKDTDSDMIKAQLAEVGMRQHKLVILRGVEKLELENHGQAARLGGKDLGGGITIPTH
jgi:hypothetical protein